MDNMVAVLIVGSVIWRTIAKSPLSSKAWSPLWSTSK